MGERMLRRLRYELFDRVLRFPHLPFPQGEAGRNRHHDQGRGGAARRLHRRRLRAAGLPRRPGADRARLHPDPEHLARPRHRRRPGAAGWPSSRRCGKPVLQLGKERQITARQLAGRIAECVDGAADDPRPRHLELRARRHRRAAGRASSTSASSSISCKFAVKFLNNLLAQMTPFLFYLVGGYLGDHRAISTSAASSRSSPPTRICPAR